eukprot:COSAG06_NODE_56628_length_283_cov_3.744565_1_plen_55_part_10
MKNELSSRAAQPDIAVSSNGILRPAIHIVYTGTTDQGYGFATFRTEYGSFKLISV